MELLMVEEEEGKKGKKRRPACERDIKRWALMLDCRQSLGWIEQAGEHSRLVVMLVLPQWWPAEPLRDA